jgi:hypothetical protein
MLSIITLNLAHVFLKVVLCEEYLPALATGVLQFDITLLLLDLSHWLRFH